MILAGTVAKTALGHSRHSHQPGISGSPQERTFGHWPVFMSTRPKSMYHRQPDIIDDLRADQRAEDRAGFRKGDVPGLDFPLYVAEFQFRYNNRLNADIFGTAIEGC